MRKLSVLVSCVAIGAMAMTAAAQPGSGGGNGGGGQGGQPAEGRPGRGGPRGMMGLAPEKAKAAWELEAQFVSHNLQFNEEQTIKVTKAYTDFREQQTKAMQDAMQKMREERQGGGNQGDAGDQGGGRGRGGMMGEEMQKVREEGVAKFKKDLGAAGLTEEQTAKASEILAAPGVMQWDRAVDAIAGLKLGEEKQRAAIQATEDYVISLSKARQDNQGDREAMRTALQEARDKMNESLKKVLSDEQFQQVEAAFRGGMMGRGQRGGDENGQGGDNGGGRRRNRQGGGG